MSTGTRCDLTVVLDVEGRDVLARNGTWKGEKGPSVRIPLLLETGGHVPGVTEGLLTREDPVSEGVLVVHDLGSSLRPLDGDAPWAHLEIPADRPLPPSLVDDLEDVPPVAHGVPTGAIEVVHGASTRLPKADGPHEPVQWSVLASAASMARHPNRLVDAVAAARARAGPSRLLYLPGLATPRNLALLTYMGADVVDDVMCGLETARGRLLRPELGHLHGPGDMTPEELEVRNLDMMRHEVALVREAIEHSALRELVEVRARSEPWQVAALRRLDRRHRDAMLPFCPVHRDRPLLALTRESMDRIEVTSWVDRILDRYSPPSSTRVLLLLPCSARKPYSRSRTHKRISDALSRVRNRWTVHEVILTSPLGAVPRELERMYPAAHYDIPVSGDWFPDEVERMRVLVDHIRAMGSYEVVINHMGEGLDFLTGDQTVVWSRHEGEGALDRKALARLGQLVSETAWDMPRVGARARKVDDVASIARVQFGPEAAAHLLTGAVVEGRPPAYRIMDEGGGQRGMVVPAKGRISLTVAGAERIAERAGNRVWMDDFQLKGDLFAVGVMDVDPGIRPGDEVAVFKEGAGMQAVGVAKMPSVEMLASSRGVAVAVRRRAPGGEGR
jgi:archaeosine synthase